VDSGLRLRRSEESRLYEPTRQIAKGRKSRGGGELRKEKGEGEESENYDTILGKLNEEPEPAC